MDSKHKDTKAHAQTQEQGQNYDRENSLDRDDELPSYQDCTPGPSNIYPQSTGASATPTIGPTVSQPFNFPLTNEASPPDYSSPSAIQRPIAIPQQWADLSSPFLPAYAPILLNYGIPASSWYSFLDTVSAFLTDTVGKRAVRHAGDIAASVGRVPKQFGKEVVANFKDTVKEIGYQAKRGNPIGVVSGVIGGAVGLSLGTATKVVGSVFSLPGAAVAAGANPKTPLERVQAYAQAANKDWFHKRGLHAHILNTALLADLVHVPTHHILDAVNATSDDPENVMKALRDLIEGVELRNDPVSKSNVEVESQLSPSGFPVEKKSSVEQDEHPIAGPSTASRPHASLAKEEKSGVRLKISPTTLWLVVVREDLHEQLAKK
ncbi:uncharacterized protein PV09_07725 [Verruconis gallopava]|uniref:Uncharacterized protein n=1 Tax=Verruconis gallopava TaxID=253628 RepID=A0A0D1XEV9_9PEZI|nr:uncharacterized protein PV09_07725 [Verruconis gallopava]KIW00741.1 hypothetical protein PV09_07725 [Verruconis gallopava]